MNSTLATSSSSLPFRSFPCIKISSIVRPSTLCFATTKRQHSLSVTSLHHKPTAVSYKTNPPLIQNLKSIAKMVLLMGVGVSMVGKFSHVPAKAESPATVTEQTLEKAEEEEEEEEEEEGEKEQRGSTHSQDHHPSPLSKLLESNSEAVDALRTLLQQKLENGEDEEALKILKKLVSAKPEDTEWKFLIARLFNEMGQMENARKVFEEILAQNPLSYEALFENALLMDQSGEGDAVIRRLEEALAIAEEEKKTKEARDVKLIIAQIQFLQKNVEEALMSYEELTKEDPNDFRPYFCRGMIYSLLDKNAEAKEQFAKYRELSPKKYEVEGYLRTPLSRMKLFGSNEEK